MTSLIPISMEFTPIIKGIKSSLRLIDKCHDAAVHSGKVDIIKMEEAREQLQFAITEINKLLDKGPDRESATWRHA